MLRWGRYNVVDDGVLDGTKVFLVGEDKTSVARHMGKDLYVLAVWVFGKELLEHGAHHGVLTEANDGAATKGFAYLLHLEGPDIVGGNHKASAVVCEVTGQAFEVFDLAGGVFTGRHCICSVVLGFVRRRDLSSSLQINLTFSLNVFL